jgi:hypothetical protein
VKTIIDRTQIANGQNKEIQIVLHSDPRYRGSLEAIQTHPLFLQLAAVQQRFVLAYLVDRNVLRAAYASGSYSNDHSAHMAGLRMLRDYRIRVCIEEYDGEPPQTSDKPMSDQELIWLITKSLRSGVPNDPMFVSMTALLMDLKSWRRAKRLKQVRKPQTIPEAAQVDELSDPFAEVRRLEAQRNSNV